LDMSFNDLTSFENSFERLAYLDLSRNARLSQIDTIKNLRVLNLSRTNTQLILSLNFSGSENFLEDIDFSYNNLSSMSMRYFSRLKRLKSVNLRYTNLIDFQFLNRLSCDTITSIDLSGNGELGDSYNVYLRPYESSVRHLRLSNMNLTLFYLPFAYEYLDLSMNKLANLPTLLYFNSEYFSHLDLSFNCIEYFINNDIEFKSFVTVKSLRVINLPHSFTRHLSYKIFYFNRLLEIAHFSSNHLTNMPKFCQVSDFAKKQTETNVSLVYTIIHDYMVSKDYLWMLKDPSRENSCRSESIHFHLDAEKEMAEFNLNEKRAIEKSAQQKWGPTNSFYVQINDSKNKNYVTRHFFFY
jgi:hypothetical protein